jgi:hypothetical protein
VGAVLKEAAREAAHQFRFEFCDGCKNLGFRSRRCK